MPKKNYHQLFTISSKRQSEMQLESTLFSYDRDFCEKLTSMINHIKITQGNIPADLKNETVSFLKGAFEELNGVDTQSLLSLLKTVITEAEIPEYWEYLLAIHNNRDFRLDSDDTSIQLAEFALFFNYRDKIDFCVEALEKALLFKCGYMRYDNYGPESGGVLDLMRIQTCRAKLFVARQNAMENSAMLDVFFTKFSTPLVQPLERGDVNALNGMFVHGELYFYTALALKNQAPESYYQALKKFLSLARYDFPFGFFQIWNGIKRLVLASSGDQGAVIARYLVADMKNKFLPAFLDNDSEEHKALHNENTGDELWRCYMSLSLATRDIQIINTAWDDMLPYIKNKLNHAWRLNEQICRGTQPEFPAEYGKLTAATQDPEKINWSAAQFYDSINNLLSRRCVPSKVIEYAGSFALALNDRSFLLQFWAVLAGFVNTLPLDIAQRCIKIDDGSYQHSTTRPLTEEENLKRLRAGLHEAICQLTRFAFALNDREKMSLVGTIILQRFADPKYYFSEVWDCIFQLCCVNAIDIQELSAAPCLQSLSPENNHRTAAIQLIQQTISLMPIENAGQLVISCTSLSHEAVTH